MAPANIDMPNTAMLFTRYSIKRFMFTYNFAYLAVFSLLPTLVLIRYQKEPAKKMDE